MCLYYVVPTRATVGDVFTSSTIVVTTSYDAAAAPTAALGQQCRAAGG